MSCCRSSQTRKTTKWIQWLKIGGTRCVSYPSILRIASTASCSITAMEVPMLTSSTASCVRWRCCGRTRAQQGRSKNSRYS
uniref:Uncharacterized protein n=1 Tax=Setaria viridis TaxID=4556 RepID=A0A4U6TYV5_SETVI|nr:hypothetical protein SEVIR_6G012850v2 [Setaria viridis]